ncbi:MAG: DMT family transporter [Acidimicrobiales bacterium]
MTTTTQPTADRIASRFPFHLIALGVLFYGTGPVLARSASTTGVLLSFWRLWFGVAILAVSLGIHRLSGRTLGSRRGLALACAAGAMFSLNQVLFFTAIKRTSVVDTTLMSTLAPVIVAIAAVPLFGERPAPAFRLWSIIAMFGAAFVVLGSSAGPSGDLLGMLMAIGSTFCFVGFFMISKVSRDEMPVVAFLSGVMTTAAICVSLFVVAAGYSPGSVGSGDLWRASAMALVPGTLGHVVMTWPLNYVPANIPPLMRLAGPVVSGTLAWVFLGEGITWVHVIGGAVIIVGAAGAIRSKAGQTLVADARATAS